MCSFLTGAQRFALLVGRRAWTMLKSRENPKPEECLEDGDESTYPVHALLDKEAIRDTFGSRIFKFAYFLVFVIEQYCFAIRLLTRIRGLFKQAIKTTRWHLRSG